MYFVKSPKKYFESEDYGFNSWLMKSENLFSLSETIGMSLVEPKKEVKVGNYFCDLICIDKYSNSKVVIESQLSKSDHEHLGKMLTYSAMINAKAAVWIVSEYDDEHSNAIRFINTHTDNGFKIYMVKIKIIKVDKTNVILFENIERPYTYGTIESKMQVDKISFVNKSERNPFWMILLDKIKKEKEFGVIKLQNSNMLDIDICYDFCHITVTMSITNKQIGINLFVENRDKITDILLINIQKDIQYFQQEVASNYYINKFVKSGTFIAGFWIDVKNFVDLNETQKNADITISEINRNKYLSKIYIDEKIINILQKPNENDKVLQQ
ncbi:MAG: hypothetical protein LBV51_00325 [Acholeplasmatales bacterium]|jgi:hypothetical protein|nr:hypothetical protein [Acholeplasmatales bacterium]